MGLSIHEQQYLRNIKVYPIYRLLVNLMIIGPILVPYMIFKGLNYSQIMLLQSISAMAVLFFEIPTGTIADRISRKFSLSLGSICMVLGLVIYIIGKSFVHFAVAELIFGLGMTFNSGADAAILYESLVKLERKNEYQHREGHAGSLIFIGQGLGSVVSSILYTRSPYTPFWVSVCFLMASVVAAFCFVDSEHKKSEHSYLQHIWKSFKISVTTPRLLWAVLFAVFMGFALRVSYWLYQPYFVLTHIDIFWYGMIFFFFNLVGAIASKYIGARYYDRRPRKVLLVLAGLMAVSFIIPALIVFPFMIVVLALQQIVRGMYNPTLRFYINHQVQDEQRATIISIVSLSGSLGFAVLSPFVGILLDKQGTQFTYLSVGVVTVFSILFLITLRRFQKDKKKRMALENTTFESVGP